MIINFIELIIIFFATFIGTFLLTPRLRKFAQIRGIVDHPGGRKLQLYPVPYLGGFAIFLPIIVYSLLLLFINISQIARNEFYLGIIVPLIIILIVGLVDDIHKLSVKFRFLIQICLGILTSSLLFLNGNGIEIFNYLVFNYIFTCFFVIFIVNGFNLIDNMDGLATGIAAITSFTFFLISWNNEQYLVAALCLGLVGGSLAFFKWNKSPASIYLGDSGALAIGFLIAAISIRIDMNSMTQQQRLLIPFLVLAVPILDTTQVIITRILRGLSPFIGGRDHISHLLLSLGLKQRTSVLVLHLISIVFSTFAYFLYLKYSHD